MIRVQANILAILVSALSVASLFMTHTLFTVVKNFQFETRLMKKEYSQFLLLLTKNLGKTNHDLLLLWLLTTHPPADACNATQRNATDNLFSCTRHDG